ncbi:angiopoietin-1 isoform X3 [Drosophila bipectinata]|uniref:angiopoietin-1 isoform X3 n=2 Tax=Drosophila bipectinata TaxID=42026 RepID=UPI0038B3F404
MCLHQVSRLSTPGGRQEQHLLNIFEIIVATLEGKLKRIDNLDKNMDLMTQRIEGLETLLTSNIVKTDFITSKLLNLESLISHKKHAAEESKLNIINAANNSPQSFLNATIKEKIENLDEKVTNIDNKLEVLKSQLDNNYLQIEDINGEASEKNSVTMNGIDILKSLSSEKMAHVSSELSDLRDTTDAIDRKLQFHINIVSENIGTIMRMMHDIYISVVDEVKIHNVSKSTVESTKSNRFVDLLKKNGPEKIEWDVVADSKPSENDFLSKTEAYLSQTQRQERAIGEIHPDLKTKANLIVNNFDMGEKHLQEQEKDLQPFMKLQVPLELPLDTTSDHLLDFSPTNFSVKDENLLETNLKLSKPAQNTLYTNVSNTEEKSNHGNMPSETTYSLPISSKPIIRKGGIIFPSIKNKPAILNSSLNTETLTLKDIRVSPIIKGFSCVDLMNAGMRQSGVFYLQIRGTTYWFLKVYCEQEISEGGWTVIQRRNDFGEPRENFNRDWADYKNGFGEPAKEFWLGNENIYMLTNNEDYTLRIELEDFDGNKKYAQYSHFKIHSEADYYKLEIDGYEGNAGDSLNDPWYGSNNSPFSTYNKDNDRSSLNCASMLKGGWWWKSCGRGLNGLYLHDPQDLTARQGIVWFRWRGWDYTLKKSTMMIRPKTPNPQLTSFI